MQSYTIHRILPMKKLLFLWILAGLSLSLQAQAQFKTLSSQDAVNPAFNPKDLRQLAWRGDADLYAYVDIDKHQLMSGDLMGEEELLLSLEQFNKSLPEGVTKLRRFPSLQWEDKHHFSFFHEQSLFRMRVSDYTITRINQYESGIEALDASVKGDLAYSKGGNLYLKQTGQDKPVAVSEDGDALGIRYGEAVHRNEFGINKGIFWAPGGQQVAFYRMDQRMVHDYPLTNFMIPAAENQPIKYPMAGQVSHEVKVGIYSLETGKTVWIAADGPADQYLTNITWTPDGKQLLIAVVNRDQNRMELQLYDAGNGTFQRTLFVENHEKYVEPLNGPVFLPENDKQFIWFSSRDGFRHLYLYNMEGKLQGQITRGYWDVTDFLGFDEKGKNLFYISTQVSPLERHAYSVSINGGRPEQLTSAKGVHNCLLQKGGRHLLDIYSNRETPRRVELVNTKNGKPLATLLNAENPLKDYRLGETEIFTLKAESGEDLYCRLIKPVGFDPTKKYPAIVYVYGGPHAQMIREDWLAGGGLFMQYLAMQGFVVFTLDNRGSAYRGRDFEQAIFRNAGGAEVQDQMKGVEYLKSLPFVDATRLGVHGWSYGGFMTISLLLKQPDVFKAGVAGGPVIDWKYYEVMYTERYMDTPEQNPEGYAASSLLDKAGNLKARLLIVHGMQDDVVVPQHSMAFVQKCIEAGKLVDYFPYPTHPHNVRGKDRAHLYDMIVQYFKDHL